MRILWLSHLVPYPPKGGVLQRSCNLVMQLAKRHELDLLAFNQPDLMAPIYPDQKLGLEIAKGELLKYCSSVEFFTICATNSHFKKYKLALSSLLSRDPYNINWLKSQEFRAAIQRSIREKTYDVVLYDTISLIPYLNETVNIPCVLDHHNIESHMLIRRADKEANFLKSWYFRQEGLRLQVIEKDVCPQFSLNITCSKMDTERLLEIAPMSNIVDVPNGVDEKAFSPSTLETKNNRLLFVGTLSWYPNAEAVEFIASQLWPKLKELGCDVQFDIVGANPPESIIKLAQSDELFNVHGFVDDVIEYFSKAMIFVCPISDGGGTKLKILDAMAMGKAIVAHPIACEGIDVVDGVNVVFAETADEYAYEINKLISDDARRELLGKNARLLIEEQFTYDAIGQQLSSLMQNILNH